jgi:hypothetical protein
MDYDLADSMVAKQEANRRLELRSQYSRAVTSSLAVSRSYPKTNFDYLSYFEVQVEALHKQARLALDSSNFVEVTS